MRILHYSLGFPPYARGGLTKYAVDLIEEQKRQGHEVIMLWPGRLRYGSIKSKVRKSKGYREIESVELVNPLPLPQIYGISDFRIYNQKRDVSEIERYLQNLRPDVVHLHTLMGITKDFVRIIKNNGIKTIYTTHDFFGICPKTVMYFNKNNCYCNYECLGCKECNQSALSYKKMFVLQSPLYRSIKNCSIVKIIRQKGKTSMLAESENQYAISDLSRESIDQYQELRNMYVSILKMIDTVHFNSSHMKKIFEQYLPGINGKVMTITHSDIEKGVYVEKTVPQGKLVFTYVGAIADYKGFWTLIEACDELYDCVGEKFQLNVYGNLLLDRPYLRINKPYLYDEIRKVMNGTDVLVVPNDVSFGFTVLEGLSFGVPVLVGENVGAKDLIENEKTGKIVQYTADGIREGMKQFIDTPELVREYSANIKMSSQIKTMSYHCQEILGLYAE